MGEARIAYLTTHPIQYQAPLLRRLAAEPGMRLKVFFASDLTTRHFVDPGFKREITWDTELARRLRLRVSARRGVDRSDLDGASFQCWSRASAARREILGAVGPWLYAPSPLDRLGQCQTAQHEGTGQGRSDSNRKKARPICPRP